MATQPHIEILMTSYNHAPYVAEQLESILVQTYTNWTLTVSDDGSVDGSWDILKRYESANPGRVKAVVGPREGALANYMRLLKQADPEADYYAWCDSDDIWLPKKLEWALDAIAPCAQNAPALYCSREIFVDAAGREFGVIPLRNIVPPSFANALVQDIAAGPTIIFNRPARDLIALGIGHQLRAHDWWCYLIISGAGGQVIYDPRPTMRYRIHGTNISYGSTKGLRANLARIRGVVKGEFHEWNDLNLAALSANTEHLTAGNREILATMARLHEGKGPARHRLELLRQGGFRRQASSETAFLYAMAAFGWF